MFAPIGQGFMIAGTTSGYAKMKNLYRVFVKKGLANNSEFEKSSNNSNSITTENWEEIQNVAGVDYTQFSKAEVPQIKLHTIFNDQYTREITLAFNPNTTDGFDKAMDASPYESLNNDIYFPINSNPYVISTLPFDIDKRIPLTIKIDTASDIKIFVGGIINFDGSDEVYLFDNVTGIYYDIKNGFYETTLPVGDYSNRYEITFKDYALSSHNSIKNNFTILQNNNNQLLSVSNPNSKELNSVTLYDVLGKQIFSKTELEVKTLYEFSTLTLSEGIYIVKLKTNEGQILNQKIVIEKQK